MILLPEHFVPDQFHVDGPYEVHPFTENKSTKYPHSEDLIELSYLATYQHPLAHPPVELPLSQPCMMGTACWSEHSPVQAQPKHQHSQGHGEGVQQMVELSIVTPAIKVLPRNVRREPDMWAP